MQKRYNFDGDADTPHVYGRPNMNSVYGERLVLTVRLCSPFNFVQGDPEFIEGSPSLRVRPCSPSLSEVEGSEVEGSKVEGSRTIRASSPLNELRDTRAGHRFIGGQTRMSAYAFEFCL
jgi:hypothetical protein